MSNYGEAIQAYGECLGQAKLMITTMKKQNWNLRQTADELGVTDPNVIRTAVRIMEPEEDGEDGHTTG